MSAETGEVGGVCNASCTMHTRPVSAHRPTAFTCSTLHTCMTSRRLSGHYSKSLTAFTAVVIIAPYCEDGTHDPSTLTVTLGTVKSVLAVPYYLRSLYTVSM